MRIILVVLLLSCLITIFSDNVAGSKLFVNDDPLPNHSITFVNIVTGQTVNLTTNRNGEFKLSLKEITDNLTRGDLIYAFGGTNHKIEKQYGKLNLLNFQQMGVIRGTRGLQNLSIHITNSNETLRTQIIQESIYNNANIDYCAAFIFRVENNKQDVKLVYAKELTDIKGAMGCHFQYPISELTNNSENTVLRTSVFGANEKSSYLSITTMNVYTLKKNITNPNDYPAVGKFVLKGADCFFEDGNKDLSLPYNAGETKELFIFCPNQSALNKVILNQTFIFNYNYFIEDSKGSAIISIVLGIMTDAVSYFIQNPAARPGKKKRIARIFIVSVGIWLLLKIASFN